MYLLLFVLILIIIYIMSEQKSDTLTYLLGLLTIILVASAYTQEHVEGFLDYASLDYKMSPLSNIELTQKDSLNKHQINTYDGLKIMHNKPCGWRHPPCDIPLLTDVDITSPVGEDIKLTKDPASYSFPTIDGDANSPQHLFMFTHNQVSPKCCPSTYSTDRGCVCLTQKQRNHINSRGGNRSAPTQF